MNNYVERFKEYFNDIPDVLLTRKAERVRARCMFIGWMLENTEITLSKLGSLINRDHSTIIHNRQNHMDYLSMSHVKVFKDYCNEYESFSNYMEEKISESKIIVTYSKENLKDFPLSYSI